jgi:DNA modification methylase
MLIHGDSVKFLETVPEGTFDHCITDWPYAIDMDNLNANNIHGGLKDLASVVEEHDVDENDALQLAIIPLIYRALKPNSFFITWMDMMMWNKTHDRMVAAGFKAQRWPLVWHKTSSCMNQSAQTNFTKNFEIAIVARKGTPTLIRPQASSVWTGSNDIESKALGHPFVKPFGLWNWLYDAVAIRGQHILEPFAGRGSMVIPAIRRGLAVTAVECNEEHYNALVVNVSGVYKTMDPKVEFV